MADQKHTVTEGVGLEPLLGDGLLPLRRSVLALLDGGFSLIEL